MRYSKSFDRTVAAILKDGKVDWEETDVLLDFIVEHEGSFPKKVADELKEVLFRSREDGMITEDESKQIVMKLDAMLEANHDMRMLDIAACTFIVVIVSSLIALAVLI